MNEIIKIILIFIVIYILIGYITNQFVIREGFEDNILQLASLYNKGEATLAKNIELQEDATITSDGKITIKSKEGDGNDIIIESGSKRIIIKGDLEVEGNLNVLGDLKVGGNFALGDDKILLNSDGSARFDGTVTIKDKYEDDPSVPAEYKTEYKEPLLFGSVFGLRARKGDGAFHNARLWGDNVQVDKTSEYHGIWLATKSYVAKERT